MSIYIASSNVAFACQRYYAHVLINELGLNHINNTNATYIKANKPVDKIVSENTSFLKTKFNLEVTDITNYKTPYILDS